MRELSEPSRGDMYIGHQDGWIILKSTANIQSVHPCFDMIHVCHTLALIFETEVVNYAWS